MKIVFRLAVVTALFLVALAAQAQFLIVPQGQKAGSVSAKRVKAELHAYGTYATVRLEMAFSTDPDWADEVDFMVKLPENTEATGFAYWFQDEYVKAKTVDKQRALAIYEFITTRRRDPALIEMVGRRQFRVRIAPVDTTKDLRVELHLVVTPTKGGLSLPLTALFPRQLESADLTLTTPDKEGWKENWGRPYEVKEGRRVYRFESKPYKAKTDWRASFQTTAPLVNVGRPEKGDGTLLVTYTARKAVSGVKLVAPKGALVHLYPSKPVNLKMGDSVTFTARIPESAPASVKLSVATASGSTEWEQSFPRTPFEERAAVVAWGARHLAALKDREEIRKWGLWLGVPSKETSWLAVPKAEERMLKEARLNFELQQYWMAVAKVGEKGQIALKQRQKVLDCFKDLYGSYDPGEKDWRMRNGWWNTCWLFASQYAKAIAIKGKGSSYEKEFSQALKRLDVYKKNNWYYSSMEEIKVSALQSAIDDRLIGILDEDEEQWSARQKAVAKVEIKRLWSAVPKEDEILGSLPYQMQDSLIRAEGTKIGEYSYLGKKESEKEAKIIFSLLPIFGNVSDLRAAARLVAAQGSLQDLAYQYSGYSGDGKERLTLDELVQKIETKLKGYKVTIRQAKEVLTSIAVNNLVRYEPGRQRGLEEPDPRKLDLTPQQKTFAAKFGLNRLKILRQQHGYRLSSEAWNAHQLMTETRRDPKVLADVQDRLKAWSKLLQQPVPDVTKPPYSFSVRDRYVLAVREHGPNHPMALELRRQMEEADGVNTGRGKYRADVLLTELELDSLSWRTLTPEEQAKRDELEKKREELFARMGDPLLIVQAPRDAKVSALLPDGRLVSLAYNAQAQRWEHRFDLPPGSTEGEVTIPVWIRHAKGQTESSQVKINVDQASPTAKLTWTKSDKGWRVEVITEAGVARVNLSLADGRRLSFTRLADRGYEVEWVLEISGDLAGEAVVIITDSAHNRTEVRRSFSP